MKKLIIKKNTLKKKKKKIMGKNSNSKIGELGKVGEEGELIDKHISLRVIIQ